MYKVEIWIEDELSYSKFINAKTEEQAEEIARKEINIEFYISDENGE